MFGNQLVVILTAQQQMECYRENSLCFTYPVSTAKNGLGEQKNSECTPRGWHRIHCIIGLENPVNSVFIARQWTGEIYDAELEQSYPGRDWILTRILQLEGMELGRNKGGDVDSLQRYIYIHGTPDTTSLDEPSSHGCVRMKNADIIELAHWIKPKTCVCIE